MKVSFSDLKDDLLFVPLGGAEEIGANSYLYHYNGKWLMLDLGIGFADGYFPGVELLVPDISFIRENRDNLVGIVLTHAHEDHIGAVQYLWQELRVPVYATKFTAAVLKAKLSEMGLEKEVPVMEIPLNSHFDIGPFKIEMIGITHSIPEMHGVVIKTPKGVLFHTGDWKFDEAPIIGETSNVERLKRIGEEGVLAMICDSTGIFTPGRSGSEGLLKKSLNDIISGIGNKLIVVTTFASNIARLHSLIEAARHAGRKVVLAGTSLWRMIDAAKQSGYLDNIGELLKIKEAKKYKREELLVIATGCQGEPLAAVKKLASNEHPDLKLLKDDVVIFASRIIPGNELKISSIFNKLCKLGVKVMTEKDHFVHVSGHPARDEVALMYEIIKPKIAIPMHGENIHIREHCDFAKQCGVEHTVQIEDGKVIRFNSGKPEQVASIKTGKMAIDGSFIVPADSETLRMRRRMRDDGLAIVEIILSKKGKLLKPPVILAPGVLDSNEDGELFDHLTQEIREYIQNTKRNSEAELDNKIRMIVKRFLKTEVGKEPKVLVQIHRITL